MRFRGPCGAVCLLSQPRSASPPPPVMEPISQSPNFLPVENLHIMYARTSRTFTMNIRASSLCAEPAALSIAPTTYDQNQSAVYILCILYARVVYTLCIYARAACLLSLPRSALPPSPITSTNQSYMEGSYLRLMDFLSLHSRLESNKEEEEIYTMYARTSRIYTMYARRNHMFTMHTRASSLSAEPAALSTALTTSNQNQSVVCILCIHARVVYLICMYARAACVPSLPFRVSGYGASNIISANHQLIAFGATKATAQMLYYH